MPTERKHQFTAKATRNESDVVLMLSGEIWPENENASSVIASELATLQEGDQLTVFIRNLYGGDTDEGITIYHDLLAYKPKVKVDGVCASMGFAIMLAGEEIEVSSHSKFMMHRPTGVCMGDFEDFRQKAERNEAVYNELADVIATRTGMSAEVVKAKLMPKGEDVWLTPQQMVEMKLADRITRGSLLRGTVALRDLRKLRKPEEILDRFAACLTEEEVRTNEDHNNTMNKELLKKLGLPETATQEQYDAAVAARIERGDAAVAQVESLQQAEAARTEAELKELLEGAVKENRMTAAMRDDLLKDAKESSAAVVLKTARSFIAAMKPHKPITEVVRNGGSAKSEGGTALSYGELMRSNPKELERLRKEEPDTFEALKEAHVATLRK